MNREEQELLAQLLAEQERRRSLNPIAHFEPHPGQQQLLSMVQKNLAPIIVALPGNRWGKTHCLVALVIAHGLGYYPWLPEVRELIRGAEFPPRDAVPESAWVRRCDGLPIRVPNELLFVTGLDLRSGIGSILQDKFRELWPQKVQVKTPLGSFGTWRDIYFPNGSHVALASAAMEQIAFEGAAKDGVFIDEPVPRWLFTAVRRGCVDRASRIIMTMTPLGDAKIAWLASDLVSGERTDVMIVKGSGRDNPFIDKERLEQFLNDPTLTDAERRARADGELSLVGRRIVTTFDEATAVIEPTTIPLDVPRVMVMDPHHARPPVMLWAAGLDNGRRWIVYRTYPNVVEHGKLPALSIEDIAKLIKSAEGRERVLARFVDPQFGRQHATVHGERFRSVQEEMADFGLHFDARVDNDLDRGIQRLRDAFRVDPLTKRPAVQIFSSCGMLVKALSLWSYKELPSGDLKPSDDQFKDPVDCLRYLLGAKVPPLDETGGEYSYLE